MARVKIIDKLMIYGPIQFFMKGPQIDDFLKQIEKFFLK